MNKKVILEIIDSNEWLNGTVDFREGDPLAGLELAESLEDSITECKSVDELYEYIFKIGYVGTFIYGKLAFFSTYKYGVFVYDLNTKKMVEHLSYGIAYEKFRGIVAKLTQK